MLQDFSVEQKERGFRPVEVALKLETRAELAWFAAAVNPSESDLSRINDGFINESEMKKPEYVHELFNQLECIYDGQD